MNTEGSKYLRTSYIDILYDIALAGLASYAMYAFHKEFSNINFHSLDTSYIFSNIKNIEPVSKCVCYGAGALISSGMLFPDLLRKSIIQGKRLFIWIRPEFCPLESVDEIIIEDANGLEKILQRSKEKSSAEWGTILKIYAHDNKAIITEILDSKVAEEKGVTTKRKKDKVKINEDKLQGYKGTQHYHPETAKRIISYSNYWIDNQDRAVSKIDSINLITFNTSQGTEVIAHNQNFTYIPKNKDDKSILIKADKKQVLEYLRLNNTER